MHTERTTVLGMMSGSSLDGLDLAVCSFEYATTAGFRLIDWSIDAATTTDFPPTWKARLRSAPALPGAELWRLHADLGHWFGQSAAAFIRQHSAEVQLIGSHGHTVFHDPVRRFTTQIGDGAAIASETGLPVVTELRGADIAAGGEGAPLAPLADQWLFPEEFAFLNLGGIANISLRGAAGNFLAGDVSGANQILDLLARQLGRPYDAGGALARAGKPLPELQAAISELAYHRQPCPKSLANEWVREQLWPLLRDSPGEPADKLHTFCLFLAAEIHRQFIALAETSGHAPRPLRVLVTGGGTHNHFLLDCLRSYPQHPSFPLGFAAADPLLADYKEAALIALCALLRSLGLPNALASATGAREDTVNGALYLPTICSQPS